MRWIFLICGGGVMGTAAYVGWAFSGGRVPVWALIAIAVFLVTMIIPFLWEYTSMGRDFGKMGGEYLADARRPYFPEKGEVEIFTGDGRTRLSKSRNPKPLVALLTAIAVGLLVYDGILQAGHVADKPDPDDTISNF